MTPEQQAYYTRLGAATDVKDKAAALKQAMIEMADAISASSGYSSVRFAPLIAGVARRLQEFEAAIAAKESIK